MCDVGWEGETAKVWNETPRRARTLHHCAGCGTPIQPGETYLDHRSFLDSWWTEAGCFWCWRAREMFVAAHAGQSFMFSELERTLRDCIGENDDPADRWRPVLASVLRRYRRSPSWIRCIHRRDAARTLAETIAIEKAGDALDRVVLQERP